MDTPMTTHDDDRELLALRLIEIGSTLLSGRRPADGAFANSVLQGAAAKIRDDRPIPTTFSGKFDGLEQRDSDLVLRILGRPTAPLHVGPDDGLPHEDLTIFKMSGRHLASLLAAARQEGVASAYEDDPPAAFIIDTPPEELEAMRKAWKTSAPGVAMPLLMPEAPPASDPEVKKLLEDIAEHARSVLPGQTLTMDGNHLARLKRILRNWGKPGFQTIYRTIEDRRAAAKEQSDEANFLRLSALLDIARVLLTPRFTGGTYSSSADLDPPTRGGPLANADPGPARLELTPEEASACGFTDSEISAAQAWQAVNEWKVSDPPHEKLPPVKSLRDELTNAALIVMRRHHYNLPGVADMAVGAMLQALEEGVTGALWNRSLGFIAAPSTITERLKCFLRMVRTTQP